MSISTNIINANLINSNKITCNSDPINPEELVTKNYMDSNLKEIKDYIDSLKDQVNSLQNFIIINTSPSYPIPQNLSLNYLFNI